MRFKKVMLEQMSVNELVSLLVTLDEIPQEVAKELSERYIRLHEKHVIGELNEEDRDKYSEMEDEVEHLKEVIQSAISTLESY